VAQGQHDRLVFELIRRKPSHCTLNFGRSGGGFLGEMNARCAA
jgi:hypothetical protein